MAEKVTKMRLNVDLQCEKCYKKVKKVLCKFPQIREQVFDEKKNIVTIKVVCCSPEKMRDKLCCKGCGAIKSIEIVPCTPPPSPPTTPPRTPPRTPPPPPPTCCVPCSERRPPCCIPCSERRPSCSERRPPCCVPCREGRPGGSCYPPAPKPAPPPPPAPVLIGTCCVPCSEGRPGGPCFEGYCRPPPCYQGYFFARPVYNSYGGGRPCYVSRCDQYFNEDNAKGAL